MNRTQALRLLGLAQQAHGMLTTLRAAFDELHEADSSAARRTRKSGALLGAVLTDIEAAIRADREADFLDRDLIRLPRKDRA
jgi:hypothetical protein